ncbi:unnamed protein product, partial [Mesorhabditis belari]|uniref:Sphingomyelin phosphodiesterase n=1 Tax=Mesorhabditis belari TaxID=2138241 RepID=A0AAF3J952_9BILA
MRLFAAFCFVFLFGSSLAGPVQNGSPSKRASEQCQVCDFFVQILHNGWGDKTLDDCLIDLVIAVCEAFDIEDNFICNHLLKDFEDVVVYVLSEILVEPNQICGLLLKDCGHFIDPFAGNWSVPLPGVQPPYKPPADIPTGKPVLNVLHLTDVHVDMYYQVGSEAKCGEPLCCRGDNNTNEITAGAGATTPKPLNMSAGYWGTIADCDIPYWTYTNMLDHIAANHKNIDYVLVTGDLESHADWDYTRETHQRQVKNISDSIRARFPNIPVYFSIGNHEGVPIDNFAPHFTPKKFHMDWLYDTMADSWQGWVPADQDATMRYMGSYVIKPYPGLRIISLNTPLGGDNVNFFLYVNQTDPDGTMTWLVNQLYAAEQAGDKVHITAHIPGGDGECLEGWAINYYNAVNRFANIITGQFFGHTHSEEFYVMFADPEDAKSTPTGVIYSAGSITTMSSFNPAYRIYKLDGNYKGSTFGVIDWEEWYFDIEKNTNPSQKDFTLLYSSVLQEYGLKNTNPTEWANMINRMVTDDALFAKYLKNYYRRTNLGPCTGTCKSKLLCNARRAHHTDKLCIDLGVQPEVRAPFYKKPASKHVPTREEIDKILLKKRANDQCQR